MRGWYRNLESNPHFTFHLKGDVKADLSATARPITDVAERRDVFQQILDGLNDPSITLPVEFPPLEDWIEFSPSRRSHVRGLRVLTRPQVRSPLVVNHYGNERVALDRPANVDSGP